tara:strand:+ start:5112 stop:5660 length:549 start_codon:yes stop_codon:yes gene_type:complete
MVVILDEVTFLVRLLKDNWSASSVALASANQIHGAVTVPQIVDVRSVEANEGRRADADSGAIIVIYEDSNSTTYPTIDHSVRNDTFTFTVHIRVLYRRDFVNTDGNKITGRTRLQDLYRIVRHIIENNSLRPQVTTTEGGTTYRESADTIKITSRTDANDRGKKLLGYRLSVEMKRMGRGVA